MTTPTPWGTPRTGDAFGEALKAHHAGEDADEIVERSDGRVAVGDLNDYFSGPDDWTAAQHWGLHQARGRVLDIGCGAGQHSLALVDAGHDVVAIDASPGAIKVATDLGVPTTAVVDIHRDHWPLPDRRPFDTVLLYGMNLGLLADRAPGIQLLRRLAAVTTSHSLLIGEAGLPGPSGPYEEAAVAAGRMRHSRLLRLRHHDLATPWFGYLRPTVQELESIAGPAGWVLTDVRHDADSYVVTMAPTGR